MKGKFGNMSNIPIGRPPVHRHLAWTRRKPGDHAACPRFEASRTHPELLSVTLGPRHLVLRPKPGKPATGWFCGSTIKRRVHGPASTLSLARLGPNLAPAPCWICGQTNKPSRLCGATEEPDGFVVNHRKPRIHGIASPRQASSPPSLSPPAPGRSTQSCLVP